MHPRRVRLPREVAACYAVTEFGVEILLRKGLDDRRARIAMRAIELMIAHRWNAAVILEADLERATARMDAALLRVAEDLPRSSVSRSLRARLARPSARRLPPRR